MAHRIEIKTIVPDTRASVRLKKIQSFGYKKQIASVTIIDVYTIDKRFSEKQLQQITNTLINPVTQLASLEKPLHPSEFSYAIEIGFLPGVTDNVGSTAKETVEDLLKIKFSDDEHVYTSQILFIQGKISEEEVIKIANQLANQLIQRIHIKNFKQYKKDNGMDLIVPKVKLENYQTVNEVNLDVDDEELIKIGKAGIANSDGTRRGPLALNLEYMKTIQTYFKNLGRKPTDIELESIAQTWSEHCKHTIFADPIDEVKDGLYKTYIKAATNEIRKQKGENDFCTSVFTDNSGAIEFDDNYLVTHKVETHNSPSALDPFGGAITGIVGVNRDAIGFGLGAKPVINTYGYCFGNIKKNIQLYKGPNFTQPMLSAKRIMFGVIDGVNSGGNCSGIPSPQGFALFDDSFQGKPLVFVGTVGLIPKKIQGKKSYMKKAQSNDYIVMVGGRVGQDGIHGATFSSEALDTGSPATAVQIGDPITQKKLSDAIVKEARDRNLYNSITDNGAGGLSCSVAEMAKECGGFEVQLEKIPLKYHGLQPWQTWISESQERMTLAVPKNNWNEFSILMKQRGVEATIIGTFTNSGKCLVTNKGKKILDLDMEFLHDGLPPRSMQTTFSYTVYKDPELPKTKNLTNVFNSLLSRLNIASLEFIAIQYDHEVQAGSVLKPLQGRGRVYADATVTKPLIGSQKAVSISQATFPSYSNLDTYHMAACSIDTAIRNLVATGADINKIALLDNFCWCSSNDPHRLRELKRAVLACYEYATAYGTPFISGKDSMFNDFSGYDQNGDPTKISILPTLLISSISVLDSATQAVSLDVKVPNDLVYILGETKNELGGSEYYTMLGEDMTGRAYVGNHVPKVNASHNKKLYKAFHEAVKNNLIASAISVHRGGLAVAIARSAIGGKLGIEISLNKMPRATTDNHELLFSESQGRLLVTINPKHKNEFEKIMSGFPYAKIGKVTKGRNIIIKNAKNKTIVKTSILKSEQSYKSTFANY